MQQASGTTEPVDVTPAMPIDTVSVTHRAQKKAPAEKIHALTSMRFFAALYVVLFHVIWDAFPTVRHDSIFGRVVSLGYLSVGFFFLLSGYILSVVYLRDGKSVPMRAFYGARFARVYPLFLATLLAGTPFLLIDRIERYGMRTAVIKTAASFVGHIFMLQAWILNLRGIDNPNWSLSVETLFYALFPFLGVWLWRLKTRSQVFYAGIAVYALSQLLVNLAYNAAQGRIPPDYVALNPLLHLGTFTMGILFARWHALYRQEHGPSPRGSLTSLAALVFAAVAYAVVVALAPPTTSPRIANGLLAPIFVAVIWALSNNRSFLSQWLSAPWMVLLGEASFGLYLIHFITYQLFEALGGFRTLVIFPLYLLVSIGLSILSFYYIEIPMRKWLLKRLQTRPKETMEAASDAQ